jgi:hypothetical protein
LKIITERLQRKLNRTLIRGAVYTLAAAVVAVFAVPSAAMADEDYYKDCPESYVSCQTGVEVSGPQGVCAWTNTDFHSTSVCVDYVGDYVYVRDGEADTFAAMGFVSTDEGEIRGRHCRNNHGYGTWARCDFDWVESAGKMVLGGYKGGYTRIYDTYLWEFENN